MVGSSLELIDALLVKVKPESFELLAKLDSKRQANVTESDDPDNGVSVLNF